jgi:hypothetical protein
MTKEVHALRCGKNGARLGLKDQPQHRCSESRLDSFQGAWIFSAAAAGAPHTAALRSKKLSYAQRRIRF